MLQISTILVMFLFVLASMPGPALAGGGSPHFLKKDTTVTFNTNNSITVHWKEAGLDTLDVPYPLSAFFNATYFCRTKSGNIPDASNKHPVAQQAASSGTFRAENGNIVASLTLNPPAAPVSQPPTCGNGQTL